MRIDTMHTFSLDAALEREAMAQVAEGIAPVFAACGGAVPRERIGLIVASDNAGSATSLRFWTEAMRVGVSVASPELFPWCLANAPCGALSRHFGITGPNATLLGEGDALTGALETAEHLFAQQRVDCAVVVALSFSGAATPGRALALRLCRSDLGMARDVDALRAVLIAQPLREAMDTLHLHVRSEVSGSALQIATV